MDTASLGTLEGKAFDMLVANNGDPGVLRPYIGADGRSYYDRTVVNSQTGKLETRAFVSNTSATLTYDQWKHFDNVMIMELQDRMGLVSDLESAGLVYNLPNGMAHTVLQYQTQTDITDARMGMDPVARSEGDRPLYNTATIPLPVVFKDFTINARELLASRNGPVSMPLDTTSVSMATRKVAELIEKVATGTAGTFTDLGGTISGLTSFSSRSTKTNLTAPTGSNGSTVVSDILNMRQTLKNNKHFGPYRLYVNKQWDEFLDTDYSTSKGDNTLRQRILQLPDIQSVVSLDFLPTTQYRAVLVEMRQDTIRLVIGMRPMLVQWDEQGGYLKQFKVIAMVIPHLRTDTAGNTGILDARTA